jgi:pentatricopeptide repeat protein
MCRQTKSGQIKPDLITYSTMIKGYCREKNLEQALVTLDEMEKRGIKADEVLYNSLLDGCCKSRQIDLAMKVY